MSEFYAVPEIVTLVDRTGKGGVEIIFDGQRIAFKPGQAEKPVPLYLAEWLSRVDQHKVHSTDGEYVHRFGVKEMPELMDSSPIEIDTTRIEGWDTSFVDRDPEKTRVVELRRNPADYANAATPGTFGPQR